MYTGFGYDWDCVDFNFEYDSFVQAVLVFRQLNNSGNTVSLKRDSSNSCLHVK